MCVRPFDELRYLFMWKAIERNRESLNEELASLRSGEAEIIEVLPMMWDAVHQRGLAVLLRGFLQESHLHATLLGEIQTRYCAVPVSRKWEGLACVIKETTGRVFSTSDPQLKDLAVVSGFIRIKGLKIAGYNMVRSLAEVLGRNQTMDLIVSMLVTEMEGELKLFEFAKA